MQTVAERLRNDGKTIALVPTMGALHEGHLSLIRCAKSNADIVVTSLFVNPMQFAPHEDFQKYPRNRERDIALIEREKGDIVFAPEVHEMYRGNFCTYVVPEKVSEVLEGKFRPTHFRGVATVVAKLFNITKPHVAVFGQKDAQQVFVIQKMVNDLNFDLQVIVAPTVRESDGLAMSSRNAYLNNNQRVDAAVIFASLKNAKEKIASGEKKSSHIISAMQEQIFQKPSVSSIDYISIANAATLEEISELQPHCNILISLAIRFDSTRLIDNIIVES